MNRPWVVLLPDFGEHNAAGALVALRIKERFAVGRGGKSGINPERRFFDLRRV